MILEFSILQSAGLASSYGILLFFSSNSALRFEWEIMKMSYTSHRLHLKQIFKEKSVNYFLNYFL